MISGLETVTTGNLYLKREAGQRHRQRGPDIAMVFQNYALYPHMTIEENVWATACASTKEKEGRDQGRVSGPSIS